MLQAIRHSIQPQPATASIDDLINRLYRLNKHVKHEGMDMSLCQVSKAIGECSTFSYSLHSSFSAYRNILSLLCCLIRLCIIIQESVEIGNDQVPNVLLENTSPFGLARCEEQV
jgi:hypothetical protein